MEEQLQEMKARLKQARGKAYYTLLKAILAECGQAILDDFNAVKKTNSGTVTVLDLAQLVLRHDLNFKATVEWLEEGGAVPTGLYDRMLAGGFKARAVLEEARQRSKEKA